MSIFFYSKSRNPTFFRVWEYVMLYLTLIGGRGETRTRVQEILHIPFYMFIHFFIRDTMKNEKHLYQQGSVIKSNMLNPSILNLSD